MTAAEQGAARPDLMSPARDSLMPELRVGGVVAGAFFLGFMGWASFIPLDAAATAEGVVAVAGNRQAVQHRDGEIVTELLVQNFPNILNVEFTAEMENRLDLVEEGSVDWKRLLHEFYDPFKQTLVTAKQNMRDVKREEIPTDVVCEKCNTLVYDKVFDCRDIVQHFAQAMEEFWADPVLSTCRCCGHRITKP